MIARQWTNVLIGVLHPASKDQQTTPFVVDS